MSLASPPCEGQWDRGSPWLSALKQRTVGGNDKFICWYTNCDNIVFPASTATLEGADNRLVRGVAHVELAFQREVMEQSLAIVTASCHASSEPD